MRKGKDKKLPAPVVGGSSLLVIFSVVCLILFALLMLQTVRNNLRTAEASRQAVADYYEADCRAEEILAEIRMGELPEMVTLAKKPEGEFYSWSCPVGKTQVLEVEVRMDGREYEILKWKTRAFTEENEEEIQDLWEGDPVTDLGI